MGEVATINIHRPSVFLDSGRPFDVFVDGKPVGKIGDGERKSFEISTGHRRIEVRYFGSGLGTLEIDLKPQEVLQLEFDRSASEAAPICVARVFVVFGLLLIPNGIYRLAGSPPLPPLVSILAALAAIPLAIVGVVWFYQAFVAVAKSVLPGNEYLRIADGKEKSVT